MGESESEFEFFEPEDSLGVVKATVHRTGKLGFSFGAGKMIDFEKNKLFKIAKKKDSTSDALYMMPVEAEDEFTFKVIKAGPYYSLKIKRLLGQLNIDYRNDSISFDIDEVKENGKRYFKLVKRKKKANNT
jgi:hypothetical protein